MDDAIHATTEPATMTRRLNTSVARTASFCALSRSLSRSRGPWYDVWNGMGMFLLEWECSWTAAQGHQERAQIAAPRRRRRRKPQGNRRATARARSCVRCADEPSQLLLSSRDILLVHGTGHIIYCASHARTHTHTLPHTPPAHAAPPHTPHPATPHARQHVDEEVLSFVQVRATRL